MKRTSGVVFSLLFVAATAAAEDFEFEVPIELSKIDANFPQGRVDCSVHGRDTAAIGRAGNSLFGSGSASFALKDGSYNEKVSIRFNVDRTLHNPAGARTWACVLSLVSLSATHPLCYIDTLTGQVSGRIPQGVNLDAKSLKACTQGTLTPQPGK